MLGRGWGEEVVGYGDEVAGEDDGAAAGAVVGNQTNLVRWLCPTRLSKDQLRPGADDGLKAQNLNQFNY